MSNSGWPNGSTKETKMLPVRQKAIVDLLKSNQLNPAHFDFVPISNDWFTIFYNRHSIFNFQFDKWKFDYCPGPNGKFKVSGEIARWEGGIAQLNSWLQSLKENILIGNPWEEIEEVKERMSAMNFDSYEEMFNEDDRNRINLKLAKLLDYFEENKITSIDIKNELKHLSEMSDKVSKKDWIMIFLGLITSWIFQDIITSDKSQNIWEFISNLFQGLNIPLLP